MVAGSNYALNPVVSGGSNLTAGTNYALNPVVKGGSNLVAGSNYTLNPVVSGGSSYGLNPILTKGSSGDNNGSSLAVNNGTNLPGGYVGSTYYPSSYYGSPSLSWISSNGYSGGNNGGATNLQGITYVSPVNTVASGGYSGGSYTSYYPQSGGYYNQPTYPNQVLSYTGSNQVLAYTDTNPSLDSVYLSDVPSTGFGDYYGIIIFIFMSDGK